MERHNEQNKKTKYVCTMDIVTKHNKERIDGISAIGGPMTASFATTRTKPNHIKIAMNKSKLEIPIGIFSPIYV